MMHQAGFADHIIRSGADQDLVVFVGSGISASCTNRAGAHPPTWKDLIRRSTDILSPDTAGKVRELVKAGRLLDAAELLVYLTEKAGKRKQLDTRFRELLEGDRKDPFIQSDWHTRLFDLDPRIIITTNFDRIIEKDSRSYYNCSSYSATSFDEDVRNKTPIVIKLHGDFNRSDRDDHIIITRSDYASLRHMKGRRTFDLVQALLLTHNALFIGYSLSDPDLQLLLQENFADRSVKCAHYLLTTDATPDYVRSYYLNCFGVRILVSEDSDYGYRMFDRFVEEALETRRRMLSGREI